MLLLCVAHIHVYPCRIFWDLGTWRLGKPKLNWSPFFLSRHTVVVQHNRTIELANEYIVRLDYVHQNYSKSFKLVCILASVYGLK